MRVVRVAEPGVRLPVNVRSAVYRPDPVTFSLPSGRMNGDDGGTMSTDATGLPSREATSYVGRGRRGVGNRGLRSELVADRPQQLPALGRIVVILDAER